MSDNNILYIKNKDEKNRPNLSPDEVFIIDDELKKINSELSKRVYSHLYQSNIDDSIKHSKPLYQYLWLRLTRSSIHPLALTVSVPLYKSLAEIIEGNNITKIYCGELSDGYKHVLIDLSNEYNVPINNVLYNDGQNHEYLQTRRFINHIPFYLDQYLSLIWKNFIAIPNDADTVFIVSPSRMEKIEPVLNEADFDYVLVSPRLLTKSFLIRGSGSHDFIPLQIFFDKNKLLKQYKLLYQIRNETELEDRLVESIEKEFGINMSQTIRHLLHNVQNSNLNRTFQGLSIENIVKKLNCENIVTNALSPGIKSILYEANELGLDTYYIPHSVITPYPRIPPSYTTMFVPSKLGVKHMQNMGGFQDTSNLILTGSPSLSEINDGILLDKLEKRHNDIDDIKILLGTQAREDDMRKRLVELYMSGIEESHLDIEPIIKIHPNESTQFYNKLASKYKRDINVVSSQLETWLKKSDLLVTVNSNIGLEATSFGTATIIINPWARIPLQPYSEYGPFPILKSEAQIKSYFSSLDKEKIASQQSEQTEFFVKNYHISDNPALKIAQYINK